MIKFDLYDKATPSNSFIFSYPRKQVKSKTKFLTSTLIFLLAIFISNTVTAQTQYAEYEYTGKIGNNAINLIFLEPDHFYNHLQGVYSYTKYNKRIEFNGEDGEFEGKVKLIESVNGKNTGYFVFNDLDYTKNKIIGKWYSMDGSKSFDVILYKK
jgi:hypothetical protein